MLGLRWHFFAHLGALGFFLGASWALLALLAAFVVALGWFLCVLDRSGLDFEGLGRLQNLIFGSFFVTASIQSDIAPDA